MMFEKIFDFEGVETHKEKTKGLGIFKDSVEFKKEKVVKKGKYKIFDTKVKGYEIHNGKAKNISMKKKNYYGTFIHGLFDNDQLRYNIFNKINPNYKGYSFKKYKKKTIVDFTSHIDRSIDLDYIINSCRGGLK